MKRRGEESRTKLKFVVEIRDPVHNYIKITEVERALIDSPFIQRLRRVHQLAGSYLVYPGRSTPVSSTLSGPCTWQERSRSPWYRTLE